MQPSGQMPNPYGNHQFQPNPFAQQSAQQPMVPIEMPKAPRAFSGAMLISFILALVLLVAAMGFGAWAYMGRQDYKNNVDKKIETAVAQAKVDEGKVKAAEYAEKEKYPYKLYKGSPTYGSVNVIYPKTWSALVTEGSGDTPLDSYYHPNYIPGLQSTTALALRVKIVAKSYTSELSSYDALAKKGLVKVSPYSAPKVSTVVGSRIEGQLDQKSKNKGVMILLPLRDKTIEISTQSQDFVKDLDNIVMAQFTFEP